jgi:hypothetical protein
MEILLVNDLKKKTETEGLFGYISGQYFITEKPRLKVSY